MTHMHVVSLIYITFFLIVFFNLNNNVNTVITNLHL